MKKKQLTEAQVNLSIQDLSSTDLQTLSQILSLAGQAEQAAGLMGMGGMGGIGGMDPVGGMPSDPMGAPVGGDPMADGIQAPGGIGENGPLQMAGPDGDYGMDAGADLGMDTGMDSGMDMGMDGMDDGMGLGDDLGGADDMDLGMDDLAMGDDMLGSEGGDDMGADEFDLTMDDLGGTDIDDDAMVEESFNRLFALCGLNESEEDEEIIEEDESAMEGEEVIEGILGGAAGGAAGTAAGSVLGDKAGGALGRAAGAAAGAALGPIGSAIGGAAGSKLGSEAGKVVGGVAGGMAGAGLGSSAQDSFSDEVDEDAPVIALNLDDPEVQQMVGDVDVPSAGTTHQGLGPVPSADAPEIHHATPSAQTQPPGMANTMEPEQDSMDWLKIPSAGGPAPSQAVPSSGTVHPGMGPTGSAEQAQPGQLPQPGQAAKPSWMEDMSEDMDVFEEVEESEDEELEEGQMYDFSLDEDAVEDMKSPGLGDNHMYGPYANDREAANDARTKHPAGVAGQDFELIKRPNGVFWKSKVNEDVSNSRPKLADVCTSGIENSIHHMEKVPGKVGDNTLAFMEAQDVDYIHASLNEQFERFMRGE